VGGVDVPCTGGRYEWTEVSTALPGACGVHDLCLVVTGGVRLSRFSLG